MPSISAVPTVCCSSRPPVALASPMAKREFLKKSWHVVGTIREGSDRTKLRDLADEFNGRLEIETLDICEQAQVTAYARAPVRPRVSKCCS